MGVNAHRGGKGMKKIENFYYAKWAHRLDRVLHVLLGITLLIGLNILATEVYWRYDISKNNRFSLSPETKAYIQQLRKPVYIIVASVTSEEEKSEDMFEDVRLLLREYEMASMIDGNPMINPVFVSIDKERKLFLELKQKFDIPTERNSITVACESDPGKKPKTRDLLGTNLYTRNASGQEVFTGESIFTEAILDVSKESQQIIYMIEGHGEMNLIDLSPGGLSSLKQFLEKRNLRVETLNLSKVPQVPEDASIVIMAGPNGPFTASEIQKLRQYLSKQHGKLIAFLRPRVNYNLNTLFEDWGIMLQDYVIWDNDQSNLDTNNNMIITVFGKDPNPITNVLINNSWTVTFGVSRPVRIDPVVNAQDGIKPIVLLYSSQSSWAESNYQGEQPFAYDPNTDIPGPIPLAIASKKVSQSSISIPSGEVIVFGNADFISNAMFAYQGNQILFYNAINACLNRENMMSIPPKPIGSYTLAVSKDQLQRLYMFMLILPLAFGLLGLLVYIKRKN